MVEVGHWMALGTTSLDIRECGDFLWTTWFQIGPLSSAPDGGQVSQRIRRTYMHWDCRPPHNVEMSRDPPFPGGPNLFWEDFDIPRGADTTPDSDNDMWHEPNRDGRFGWVQIEAAATFIPGKAHEPPGYWPAPEGIDTSPYPTLTRRLLISWNCCECSEDRGTVLTPEPSGPPTPP
jgi:hypothetical protein